MVKLWEQEAAAWRLELDLDGEALALRMGDEARQMRVSLGGAGALTPELVRRAAAKAVQSMCRLGAESAAADVSVVAEKLGEAGVAALAQGAELARYQPKMWKEKKERPFTLYLTGTEAVDGARVLAESAAVTAGVCFARDLVNLPANKLTPEMMAQQVTQAAQEAGMETQVLCGEETRALGMEAYHAVGDSAGHPPRLIVLRYRGGAAGQAPLALVGKAVCFDTGGYSLKTAQGMRTMKCDMAGGAAVAGAMLALAKNHVPVNVTAVIPAVENRISPDSFLPGDVIGSMAGKSIEIGSTDAEGRLILADAITYAITKEGAAKVVDIATLTGAIARMLGGVAAGVMANDDSFYDQLQAAAGRSGEKFWRMPNYPEYKKLIESPLADLYNSSNDGCGAIAAGMFLSAFAGDTPWLHLDIAGTAWNSAHGLEYQGKGATGMGVTTLYELCRTCGAAERSAQ